MVKRSKTKIAKTTRERVKAWRDKRAEKGGRSLTVWLEADTAKMLELLLDEYPNKNNASLVAMAIETQFKVTQSQKPKAGDPSLDEIKGKLSQSMTMGELKPSIVAWILNRRDQGLTHKQISDILIENGIPTFSGRGKWQKGTISKYIKR